MKRLTQQCLTLATTFACLGLFTMMAAHAQINVYINTPPPPIRYDLRPPPPNPGLSWIDGFWEPSRGQYRWHPGYWQQPPFENAYYVHPHYDHVDRGWRLREGYWSHEDHHARYEDEEEDHGGGGRHHDNGNHYGQYKHGKDGKDKDKDDHD